MVARKCALCYSQRGRSGHSRLSDGDILLYSSIVERLKIRIFPALQIPFKTQAAFKVFALSILADICAARSVSHCGLKTFHLLRSSRTAALRRGASNIVERLAQACRFSKPVGDGIDANQKFTQAHPDQVLNAHRQHINTCASDASASGHQTGVYPSCRTDKTVPPIQRYLAASIRGNWIKVGEATMHCSGEKNQIETKINDINILRGYR